MKHYILTFSYTGKKKKKSIVFDRNTIPELVEIARNCQKLDYDQVTKLFKDNKVKNGSWLITIEEKETI